MLVTFARYPDRAEMVLGHVLPGQGAEMVHITEVPKEEIDRIMLAKTEEVQKILSEYV